MTSTPPLDEFDAVVLQHDGRRGAHRARPNRVATVVSAGLVAAATLAVGGGAYVLLGPGSRATTPAGASTAAAGAVVDPAAGDAATGDAAAGDAAPTPDASAPHAAPGTTPAGRAGRAEQAAQAVEVADGSEPGALGVPTAAAAPRSTAGGATAGASAGTSARTSATARATATTRSAARSTGSPDPAVPLVVLNGTRTKGLAATASTHLHASGWKVQSTGNDRSGATATTVTYADPALAATAAAVAADIGGSAVRDASATEGVLTVVLGPGYSG